MIIKQMMYKFVDIYWLDLWLKYAKQTMSIKFVMKPTKNLKL